MDNGWTIDYTLPLSCLTNDDSFLLLPSDKWIENQNKQGRKRI